MDGRKLGTGLMVLASSLLLMVGTASAHGTVKGAGTEGEGSCTVKSLPSFIAQGEFGTAASVGDVIEISCDPYRYSQGAEVTLTASQLYSRCHEITWYDPNDGGTFIAGEGRSFSVHLDVDGNANVGLIAGPKCMVGESLITLDENESPYETFTTSFQVLPAVNTPQGLYVTPSSQVEDAESSGVVTAVQAEFSHASEQSVRLGYGQLYDRCERGYHTILVPADREAVYAQSEALGAIELDNNGNGFALLIGSDSCAEGTSLIEGDLESSPFTTETGTFTVESPRVRFGA
jgi:hypothetical protein